MGSYTFKWEHPDAEEVFVTGTFDDWTKSVKLDKKGDVFEKTVDLKDASKKIYYKFVVDNNWVLNDSAPKETDTEGNINNFLAPEQIATVGIVPAIGSVGPESTTAKMAGEVPKESAATPSDVPGGFPESPANELDKPIGINPLPATDGAVNPPSGQQPALATTEDINKNVKLDKASYENSDAIPGVATATTADSAKPIIPESGLPVTDNTISSVGPQATTVGLAGQVPKESSKVPETVKESQSKAGADPEASAVAEEVREKNEVETELKQKVPEAAATSTGTAGVGTEKTENTGAIAGGLAAAGGTVAGAAILAKDTAVEKGGPAANQAATTVAETANQNLPDSVKEKLPVAAQNALKSQNKEETREEVSPQVPAEVKDSITESGKGPEAAGSTTAVGNKEKMESELLKEVKPAPAVDETKGKEETPEAKPKEPVTDAGKAAEPLKPEAEKAKEDTTKDTKTSAPANGSSENKTAESSGAAQKKKNRLSSMLSKIKHKISDK